MFKIIIEVYQIICTIIVSAGIFFYLIGRHYYYKRFIENKILNEKINKTIH